MMKQYPNAIAAAFEKDWNQSALCALAVQDWPQAA
jgi:hypothetical protein